MAYAGTPAFAVPALEQLINGPHEVVAVYTQPDRPAGRGRQLRASAVKACALHYALPIEQPASLSDASAQATLAGYAPDVLIVAAYGLILPAAILAIPNHGCLNIHASLLPRWRGAAPIHRAIEAGDEQTGVCLMEMAPGLDTGPVVVAKTTPIGVADTAGSVHERLASMGAQLIEQTLADWAAGDIKAKPQSERGVTYANKITTAEATLDWQQPALTLARKVRAFNPWPVARTQRQGQALRIWNAQAMEMAAGAESGTVIAVDPAGIDVATAAGVLRLTEVQAAGGKPQSADEFLRGHDINVGEQLN